MNPGGMLNCSEQCRFQDNGSSSTYVAYIPVYDKNGVNTNPDMNTIKGSITCIVCNRSFGYTTQAGITTWEEK